MGRKIEFTEEELGIIQDALAVHANFMETGTIHMSWDDAQRLGKDHWDDFGIRPPSTSQIQAASKMREIWIRLLNRRTW